jgi:ACR3 family arsenite efflux pump ArsB
MTGGNAALTAVLVVVGMVLPLVVLGVVCWIFLRAKRREDARGREDEGEAEWRNAHSS